MTNGGNGSEPAARYSLWFVIIAAVFVTCLITSNILAVKLISVADLILPAAIIIFPLSYIIGDVLTEVYGYREARRVIWLGFACNLLAVVINTDLTRNPAFVDQGLVEPRAFASAKDRCQQVGRGLQSREIRIGRPVQVQPRQLHAVGGCERNLPAEHGIHASNSVD